MKLIDKNKLLEELKKLKQNLSASPIVVIEDVESLVESLEVKDYEQKYLDALAKAREIHRNENEKRFDMEWLFPELKESWDKRIKNDIKRAISVALDYSYFDKETADNCLAWLEKQRTSEEALQYVKDNHSPSEASDFQAAMNIAVAKAYDKGYNDGLEKQGSEPNWCHHKVDLSNCSEEYRKAYYDGWNNCNMQHSQCKSDGNDVVKCLINGMKFYCEGNEDAMWGTDKFSMKVKDILSWLEKQGEQDNWAEELNTKIKELHKQCLAKIQEYITPCLGKMSEEDENHIIGITQTIGGAIKHNVISHKTGDMQITWLKSLKNRVIPQPKQEWSEHKKLIKNDACVALTKKMLYDIILDLKVFRDKDCSAERKAAYQREIDWLENLKKKLGG